MDAFTSEGSLQTTSWHCVLVSGSKLVLGKCDRSTGTWQVNADVHGCGGSTVHALNCDETDEAAYLRASFSLEVAVPA